MTERFNVAGALLVKLFGRPDDEDESFRARAGRVRDIGVTSAMYGRAFFVALTLVAALAQALVYGLGGYFALHRSAVGRHRGHPGAAADPAVRAADRAVERAGRRDERAGQLRPGLRGARPGADDRRRPTTRSTLAGGRAHASSSTTCGSPTRAPTRCRWPRWRTSPCSTTTPPQEVLHGVSFRAEPGSWSRWSARPAPARRRSASWCRGSTTCDRGAVRVGGHDVRTSPSSRCATAIGVVSQDAHMFHDTIRGNLLLRPAGRHRRASCGRRSTPAQIGDLVAVAARRARHRGRRPRLPAVRRREAAAGDRPAAAQGAGDRDPGRGHRAPGQRERGGRAAGAGRRRWPAGPRWSSRTGCPRSATPT